MGRSSDVLVIGAGIAGAAAAYFLAEAGFSVTIIEAHRPRFGASGRNPGFLWLQTKTAGAQMHLGLEGRRFQQRLHEDMGGFAFRECGGLITFRDESMEPVARAFVADRRRAGLPVELIDGPAAREICPALGPRVRGAVWNPLDAHQDTPLLVDLLIAKAERLGATLRSDSAARELILSGGRCSGVTLASGETVSAGATVIAAGPGSLALLEGTGLQPPTILYKFEAAETAPVPTRIDPVLCGQALFRFFDGAAKVPRHSIEQADPDLGFTEQVAQYADGRIRFGCAFRTGTDDDSATAQGQALAREVLPESLPLLSDVLIERSWAGVVLQTRDGMPVVGPASGIGGLWLNIGHFFGNLAGALCGRLVADLIQGAAPILDPSIVALDRPALRG